MQISHKHILKLNQELSKTLSGMMKIDNESDFQKESLSLQSELEALINNINGVELHGLAGLIDYVLQNLKKVESFDEPVFSTVEESLISAQTLLEHAESEVLDNLKGIFDEYDWNLVLPEEQHFSLMDSLDSDYQVIKTSANEKEFVTDDEPNIDLDSVFQHFCLENEAGVDGIEFDIKDKAFNEVQKEIFGIFVEELDEVTQELAQAKDIAGVNELLNYNLALLENLSDAAETIEFHELPPILKTITNSIESLNGVEDEPASLTVAIWPYLLKEIFEHNINSKSINLIAAFLLKTNPDLTHDDVKSLVLPLAEAEIQQATEEVKQRPEIARIEDLSLAVPSDVNSALLKSFLDELPDQVSEFSTSIQNFVERSFVSDLHIARRIAHTIKGSGFTVGIDGMGNFTHHLEDILDSIAKSEQSLNQGVGNLLIDSADSLEQMSECLLEEAPLPNQVLVVYQSILDLANNIAKGEFSLGNDTVIEPISIVQEEQQQEQNTPVKEDKNPKPASTSVKVSQKLIDNLIRIAGENMISSGRIQEHARTTKNSLQLLRKQHGQLNGLVSDLEQLVFIRGISSDRSKVDGDFDPLEMEQYNELHTATQRLIEAAVDGMGMIEKSIANVANLESVVVDQVQLQRENQNQVIQMRMLPVSYVASRFARAIRQACRLTGKKVNFELIGEDTYVDSNVLMQLVDPLMHILRNAVDHGIEKPEERLALGKAEEGTITLSFDRVADQILVECSDDGGGLDADKIMQRAKENNLINESYDELSMEEVTRFILIPGFSTKDEVSQVSGRGIGMDVVNQKIQEIKGNLKINSDAGSGMTVSVSLPVSLMSTHALLVEINGNDLAISNHGIEDIVYLEKDSVQNVNGKDMLTWKNEMLNVFPLSALLEMPSDETNKIAIIVRLSDGSYKAITVPFVLDSRDLVLKPLSKYLPRIDGLVGASILGDGRVTPVVDLTELNTARVADQFIINKSSGLVESQYAELLPTVLVVDDSLSARRSMSQFVTDLGYSVVTAKDGIEAQQALEDNYVIAIITDLEMPRMNGIDLTRHLKARQEYKEIPVFMVTSRSTSKHQELAEKVGVQEYFTKPFDEDLMAQKLNQVVSS